MAEQLKTNYRKVFKSDHLSVADLEELLESGKRLVFTIKEVKQEINVMVAGKRGNHNIAYFKEDIKPLVLNATNSKVVKGFNNGSYFIEDWNNTPVELYVDRNVRYKGETTDGIRINPIQPTIKTVKPTFTKENFEKAKKAGATIEKVKEVYTISSAVEKEYIAYVAKK